MPHARPNRHAPTPAPELLAVCAGKGGVGASMFAANLAVFLSQIGKRIVIADLDLAGGGLHRWLAMPRPERTAGDAIRGRVAAIDEVIARTPVAGLEILAQPPDLLCGELVTPEAMRRLLAGLGRSTADFVVADLPAGLHAATLAVLAAAERIVIVTVATPDAVEASYRLMLAVCLEKILRLEHLEPWASEALREMGRRVGRLPSAREMVSELATRGSVAADEASRVVSTFRPLLVFNQVRVRPDAQLGEAVVLAARRFLGVAPLLLGTVEWDDNVWLALRRGQMLLVDFPQSRACKDIERIVRRLLSQDLGDPVSEPAGLAPTERQNLYEVLDLYPGASEEEVRRALKRAKDWFGSGALAVQGACDEEERRAYLKRCEEAHATLVDRARRRDYDRETFPDGPRPPVSRTGTASKGTSDTATRPGGQPVREVPEGQVVDGAFLGRVRRDLGLRIEDISNRVKISPAYLRAIEDERFSDLPEAVYVRGYVTELARTLKLDPRRAARDFMARYEAARRRGPR